MLKSLNVNVAMLVAVTQGTEPITSPVGKGRTAEGQFVTAWVATDRETKAIRYSDDGKRVKLNLRIDKPLEG